MNLWSRNIYRLGGALCVLTGYSGTPAFEEQVSRRVIIENKSL